jgi:hypothetical protein
MEDDMGTSRHTFALPALATMLAASLVALHAQTGGYRQDNARLSGTYQLDPTRSDNPQRIADQATRTMGAPQRDRAYQNLLARLDAPETISIDVRGRTVSIMSSTGPQLTFDADGRNRTETGPGGRPLTTRADLRGDGVVVETTGNRGSDYTVTFDPTPDGLRVTRQLDNETLNTMVTSHSVYRRVATEPRWNVYNGANTRRSVLVPEGTQLRARLDQSLSTRDAREGQRFTMTVIGPGPYNGASLDGVIARAGSDGGHANMVFDFDRIRLRNGQSGDFEGAIESVRTPNGETIQVNRSGSVRSSSGGANVPDTAVGAALGAIIGAIAGGGKGAAIGGVVGGAGTVIVEGRSDLNLPAGSEMTISAVSNGRAPGAKH